MYPEKTTILVDSLRLESYVGVSREERKALQTIEADIRCELTQPHITRDSIDCTISYSDIVATIHALMNEQEFVLLETMAEEMAKKCFCDARVERVKISLRKPNKLPSCAAVGVERIFTR